VIVVLQVFEPAGIIQEEAERVPAGEEEVGAGSTLLTVQGEQREDRAVAGSET
jgi:hypothetical protein